MKLMPPSMAARMTRTESSWSGLPQPPNIMVPRAVSLTEMPVEPRNRRGIVVFFQMEGASILLPIRTSRLLRRGTGQAQAGGVRGRALLHLDHVGAGGEEVAERLVAEALLLEGGIHPQHLVLHLRVAGPVLVAAVLDDAE